MKFSGVTILQGVEFSIFPIDFEWALQQCSATALPVITITENNPLIGTNEVLAGDHMIHTRNVINTARLGQTCHSYFF